MTWHFVLFLVVVSVSTVCVAIIFFSPLFQELIDLLFYKPKRVPFGFLKTEDRWIVCQRCGHVWHDIVHWRNFPRSANNVGECSLKDLNPEYRMLTDKCTCPVNTDVIVFSDDDLREAAVDYLQIQ